MCLVWPWLSVSFLWLPEPCKERWSLLDKGSQDISLLLISGTGTLQSSVQYSSVLLTINRWKSWESRTCVSPSITWSSLQNKICYIRNKKQSLANSTVETVPHNHKNGRKFHSPVQLSENHSYWVWTFERNSASPLALSLKCTPNNISIITNN